MHWHRDAPISNGNWHHNWHRHFDLSVCSQARRIGEAVGKSLVVLRKHEGSTAWLSIQYIVQASRQFAKLRCDVAIEYTRSSFFSGLGGIAQHSQCTGRRTLHDDLKLRNCLDVHRTGKAIGHDETELLFESPASAEFRKSLFVEAPTKHNEEAECHY